MKTASSLFSMPYQVQLASGKAGEMGNEITKLGHEGISTECLTMDWLAGIQTRSQLQKKETWMEQKLRIYRTLVLQFGTIFLPQNGHSL
jgi:hypothetical protein